MKRRISGLVLGYIFLFVGIALILSFRQIKSDPVAENFRFVPPPPGVQRFAFGYNETMADSFWIRVIQSIDICEKVPGGHVKRVVMRTPVASCDRGWVFQMFDAVTSLAPKWKMPYRIGGTVLSLLVDDREGARIILEKGMKAFPTDYNIHYSAAYHYIWEMQDPKRAADAILVAAAAGGPPWFYSLAAKLLTESGQAELARSVLERELETFKDDPEAQKRIRWRLNQINESQKKSSASGK